MSEEELARRADDNYFQSWRIICGNAVGGEVSEHDGLLLASSGLPAAAFNLALVTRELADPAGAVADAAAFFDARTLPFVVRVREGVDPAAEHACEERGLPYSDDVPGLVQAPIGRALAPPVQLVVKTAKDEAGLEDHRMVMSGSFGFPMEAASRVLTPSLLDVSLFELYVGYVDGVAVASSALMVTDGVAGVYNVGCLPGARKQGLGEAMTWHAVECGRAAGCDIASLQASEMGRPIYERMGFRFVAPYRTFTRR